MSMSLKYSSQEKKNTKRTENHSKNMKKNRNQTKKQNEPKYVVFGTLKTLETIQMH